MIQTELWVNVEVSSWSARNSANLAFQDGDYEADVASVGSSRSLCTATLRSTFSVMFQERRAVWVVRK